MIGSKLVDVISTERTTKPEDTQMVGLGHYF